MHLFRQQQFLARGLLTFFFLAVLAYLLVCLTGNLATLGAEPSSSPQPFDPADTRHGYANFDTMPVLPSDHPPEKESYYQPAHQDPSIQDRPKGLFQELVLAEDVEEELQYRRGHIYYPINPTDQFSKNIRAIYVVFRVFKHYAPYQIFAQLYPQAVPEDEKTGMLDEDIVFLATEDESGYFKLFPPDAGWQPGIYQVRIFVGFEANAVTRMGTLQFTILPS